jgi:hypothetical protein
MHSGHHSGRKSHHRFHGEHLEQRLVDLLVARDRLHLGGQVLRLPQVTAREDDGVSELDRLLGTDLGRPCRKEQENVSGR